MTRRRHIVPVEPHLVVHDLFGTRVTLLASALAAPSAVVVLAPSDPILGPLVHIEAGGWKGCVVDGWKTIANELEVLGSGLDVLHQRQALLAYAEHLRAKGAAVLATQSEAT